MSRYNSDPNPFDEEEEVNPFSKGSTAHAPKARIPPLGHEPMGFGHNDATVDIPLDTMNVMDFVEIKRREDAVAKTGITPDDKNWPPFFPIIHHDIANEIPINAQRLQYLAFASCLHQGFLKSWNGKQIHDIRESLNLVINRRGILAAVDVISDHLLVGIFYLVGFGLFCLESLLSLWVLQGPAAAQGCHTLLLPFSALSIHLIVPTSLGDAVYDYVAKRHLKRNIGNIGVEWLIAWKIMVVILLLPSMVLMVLINRVLVVVVISDVEVIMLGDLSGGVDEDNGVGNACGGLMIVLAMRSGTNDDGK
ncbi:unnamed protein product [Dovyalis caffra]|uniref:Secretory carrier-associated membrane protein n=1 Tax=Dovyalis caffra TaxID=77055 RepID=A0AAV1SQV1_9ROSI|nr:unnamed protein product [Dovyalis caffra]